ncbi:uncharacterized protein LOC114239694 [Bombyx mandarina]|uniref:Fibrohexamerin-like n=2 Tax=Bombyx TaxID=7090 RepID=A0A8R2C942_BOMMO|nr:uncharacterized protein LOC105842476 [Bombyx mori]XP_028025813.1 uncharacterized protein LOC114239694 [Bombyx mandarina]
MEFELCLCILSVLGLIAADDCCNCLDPADDPNNIERPCPNFDLDCIRDFFCSNAQCEVAYGPVPEPLFLKHYRLDAANANITGELYNVNVAGLNGNVVEFYVNRATEKVVLAMEVRSLRFHSPLTIFKYNRKRKEPIERSDYVEAVYGGATFTAVFPSICDLDLDNVEVFSYIEDSNPEYTLGSCLTSNLDFVAEAQVQKFINSMSDNIKEKFITQGKLFMINYIQYNICDFGL